MSTVQYAASLKALRAVVLTSLLCSISNAALADLNSELIAYYPLNGNADDSSGNGNHGILHGNASLTTDMLDNPDNAYAFDGSNSYIDVNLPVINTMPNSKVTVSFWMNWGGNEYAIPFGFDGYDVWFTRGYFGFNTNQGDIWGVKSDKFKNHWVFVTAIFNNGDVRKNILYVNGVKQAFSPISGSLSNKSVSTNARIGYYTGGGGGQFSGKIDDVRIYNRDLSNVEVKELYYDKVPSAIKGSASWATVPYSVECRNNTTSQSVTIADNKTPAFDCSKAGLVTNSNDEITVTIKGKRY